MADSPCLRALFSFNTYWYAMEVYIYTVHRFHHFGPSNSLKQFSKYLRIIQPIFFFLILNPRLMRPPPWNLELHVHDVDNIYTWIKSAMPCDDKIYLINFELVTIENYS